MAVAIPPAAGLLRFSFICLKAPVSRCSDSAGAVALPSLTRAESMRAAASAAKLVSTMGMPPPPPCAGFLDLAAGLCAAGLCAAALGAADFACADFVVALGLVVDFAAG